jgi:hypothetical protein
MALPPSWPAAYQQECPAGEFCSLPATGKASQCLQHALVLFSVQGRAMFPLQARGEKDRVRPDVGRLGVQLGVKEDWVLGPCHSCGGSMGAAVAVGQVSQPC